MTDDPEIHPVTIRISKDLAEALIESEAILHARMTAAVQELAERIALDMLTNGDR